MTRTILVTIASAALAALLAPGPQPGDSPHSSGGAADLEIVQPQTERRGFDDVGSKRFFVDWGTIVDVGRVSFSSDLVT